MFNVMGARALFTLSSYVHYESIFLLTLLFLKVHVIAVFCYIKILHRKYYLFLVITSNSFYLVDALRKVYHFVFNITLATMIKHYIL